MADLSEGVLRLATNNNARFIKDLYQGLREINLAPLAPHLNLDEAIIMLASQNDERTKLSSKGQNLKLAKSDRQARQKAIAYLAEKVKQQETYKKERPGETGEWYAHLPKKKTWNPHQGNLQERLMAAPEQALSAICEQLQEPHKTYLTPTQFAEHEAWYSDPRRRQQFVVMRFLTANKRDINADEHKEAYLQEALSILKSYDFKQREEPRTWHQDYDNY